jgi:hypothetical protein
LPSFPNASVGNAQPPLPGFPTEAFGNDDLLQIFVYWNPLGQTQMPLDIELTRREFLASGVSAAALAARSLSHDIESQKNVAIGQGEHKYELIQGWGAGSGPFGWGVGIVCDSQDRVYVHSRTQKAVVVLDRNGNRLYDFGSEFAASGHGLYLNKEGGDEFLYFSDHGRNLVVKTDLSGRTVMRIGDTPNNPPYSIQFRLNQPTNLAIAPNGDIFVAEGYGGDRVQAFNRNGRHLRALGRPGSGPGQFSCPHGIWVDTRKREPELYVADRSNQRIQVLTLDGRHKRTIMGITRLPNGFYERGGKLFIADLDQRVTILDEQDRLVCHLGDGKEQPWVHHAAFDAPHAACVDSQGDLYVIEWTENAVVRKFRHSVNSG